MITDCFRRDEIPHDDAGKRQAYFVEQVVHFLPFSSHHSPPVRCNVLRALKFGAGALHHGSGSCHPQTQKIALVRQQQRETGKVLHWLVTQGPSPRMGWCAVCRELRLPYFFRRPGRASVSQLD